MPGPWRADNSPWVKPVMEAWGDDRVRHLAVRCAAQSSKTQTLIACLCWSIAEDPGPAMWVMAARDEAVPFVRERVAPTLDLCPPVKAQLLHAPPLQFVFASMPLYFTGAGSKSKLQGKPIRWLILDEVRNYPKGALDMVLKRTRSFWNSRVAIVSTPENENDAVDRAYKLGNQQVWNFPCPKCGTGQPLRFEQLKWNTDTDTKPDGAWDFDKLADTIRYECVFCSHPIRDTPAERRDIARNGFYVAANPRAPKSRVSFTWSALLPPWVPWRTIAEEYIQARKAARPPLRDRAPMKTFITETLGESWTDELGEVEDYEFLTARQQNYDYGEVWAEELVRFMSADKQASGGEHYWWVIRAFAREDKSRLIAYGKAFTLGELEELRKKYGVAKGNAVIDSGFRASDVYQFSIATGWKPFKGEDNEYFLQKDPDSLKVYRRAWQTSWVDPALGKTASHRARLRLYRWSNPAMKDLFGEHITGLAGEWTLPRHVGREYFRHIASEHRESVVDSKGRVKWIWKQVSLANHLRDCELQLLTIAVIIKLTRLRISEQKAEVPQPAQP
jgi:hypothetical protein